MFEFGENIVNGVNGSKGITVRRDTVRENDFFNSIDEEKDIVPFTVDFDIGFVAAELVGQIIGETVDKRLDDRSDGMEIVENSLVRDFNFMNVEH